MGIVLTLFLNDPLYENFHARFSAYYKLDPIADLTRPMTFPEANTLQNQAASIIGRKAFESSHVCAPLKFSTFQSVLKALKNFSNEHPNGGGNGAVLFEFHNNIYNIPSNATAYPHRKKIYHVVVAQQWLNEIDDEDSLKWIKHVANLINKEYSPNTVTLNFHSPILILKDGDIILEDDVDPRNVYGDNLEKLKEIKAK